MFFSSLYVLLCYLDWLVRLNINIIHVSRWCPELSLVYPVSESYIRTYFSWYWRHSQRSPIGQMSEEGQEDKLFQLNVEITYAYFPLHPSTLLQQVNRQAEKASLRALALTILWRSINVWQGNRDSRIQSFRLKTIGNWCCTCSRA